GADGPRPAGPQATWPAKNGQRWPEKNGSPQPAQEPAAPGITPIGALTKPGRATVEGRIRVVEIRPVERNSVLAAEVSDGTGQLTAMFYGRSHIPGIVCGARVRFRGSVGIKDGHPVMTNPAYELLFPAL
ncbi:MAG TPA: OB-fold nucleic acid binding domain-containing protein, partial [Streptosporangiaceae bacterium]|nr:OB-fold nucleic acid binding domain-containing protein [Streptosporangiaceae bacterium]